MLRDDGRFNPSPCPYPSGRGTLEFSLRVIRGFLLPWGEGQDEGRFPSFVAPRAECLQLEGAAMPR